MSGELPGDENSLEDCGLELEQDDQMAAATHHEPLFCLFLSFSMFGGLLYVIGSLQWQWHLDSDSWWLLVAFLAGHTLNLMARVFLLAHQLRCHRSQTVLLFMKLVTLGVEVAYICGAFFLLWDRNALGRFIYYSTASVATLSFALPLLLLLRHRPFSTSVSPEHTEERRVLSAALSFIMRENDTIEDEAQFNRLRFAVALYYCLQIVFALTLVTTMLSDWLPLTERPDFSYWWLASLAYLLSLVCLLTWRVRRYGLAGAACL